MPSRFRIRPPAPTVVRANDRGARIALPVALGLLVTIGSLCARALPITITAGTTRQWLAAALLLNVVLALVAVQRHRRLQAEIALRRAVEARMETLASRDALTGLANRRSLTGLAGNTLSAATLRRQSLAVLTIDLDQFHGVNEGHGHEAGDLVLTATAQALQAIMPPTATIARLGGDEFACLVPYDPADPDAIDMIAVAILTQLSRPIACGRQMVHVTVSIGMAQTEAGDASVDPAMRRAGIALSAAKKAGGGRCCWFDTGMGRELDNRNAIEAGLRLAIPAGRIIPYYEQQIDLASGRLEGFEVLARWDHPTEGILMPDSFIPIAEEAGLIGDLSLSIMRQAFEHASGWDQSLTLSVNISPVQLKDPWLAEKILKLLTETGFPGHRLEIEITETSLFDNLPLARSIVASLKNQGVRLALDDFGTGYSSLAHLRALPFDRIKIDKSFVMAMAEDPESIAIVEAITRLGHSLSVPVTAEGVETAAIAARLQKLGCRKVQGWHYGRPLTIAKTRRLLADNALLDTATARVA